MVPSTFIFVSFAPLLSIYKTNNGEGCIVCAILQKCWHIMNMNSSNLILLLISLLLFVTPLSEAFLRIEWPVDLIRFKPPSLPMKKITIINKMSHAIAIKCYGGDPIRDLGSDWVEPSAKTSFEFCYPLSPKTSFKCTINGGRIVAYQQSYECANNKHCKWKIYDDFTKVYSWKRENWLYHHYETPIWKPRCLRSGFCIDYPRLPFKVNRLPPQGC